MLNRVIKWSIAHRIFVAIAVTVVSVVGIGAVLTMPVDAIPDLSDAQVIVMTDWPGQSPQIVEDQITYPLETELLKVPHTKVVRGMSQFGLSAVYVVFEDGTDLYWARSRVVEYLNGVRDKLPAGVQPILGPDATGVGWVMQYILTDTTHRLNLGDLRGIEDFVVRPALTSVPGVSEIAALGGYQKEYQVEVDPAKLAAFGIPLQKVVEAVRSSNEDAGGRVIEMGGTEYVVRGRGRFRSIDDIRGVAIGASPAGTPIVVGDVANVQIGPAIRRGIADLDGKGEVVTGWVVMRHGANPMAVIKAVKEKMKVIERSLPPGVKFADGYDRSGLISAAIRTLRGKLIEESVIVAIVTILFLFHAQSAVVAIATLPIGLLMAFIAMRVLGQTANIMSLGGFAVAIGAMIDAAIVMVENLHKHLEREMESRGGKSHWAMVIDSATEVGGSLFISLLIITVSFLPVFALQDQEGRLFKPLAWTKTLAMASAALLSITLVPVAMGLFVRGGVKPEASNPINRMLIRFYRPLIRIVLRHRWATIAVAFGILAITAFPWSRLGSEFMPPLNEGAIMDMPSLFPGVGAGEAALILRQRDAALARIPEVKMVLGKIGRAETATDMAPLSMIETIAILKDRGDWRSGVSYDSIVAEANNTVRTPGVGNMWSMPIKNRLDMLATGIKTPVGIKIFGPDLATLDRLGKEIEAVLPSVRGTNTVFSERAVGGRYIDVSIDRAAAARSDLNPGDVQAALSAAIGGADAGTVIDGRNRFGILVRYPRGLRDDVSKIRDVLVATPSGAQIALGELASILVVPGPTLIKSEDGNLNNVVYVDVRNRDIGGYVNEARSLVERRITMPAGYRLEWSGQYESMQRASQRLRIVIPLTLLVIFGLLYFNFRSVGESFIVMLSLPFALAGGVWLMWLLGYNLSVPVAIGFIALAGVAAQTGVILLIYLDHAWKAVLDSRLEAGETATIADLDAAVESGAVDRLRPKMMTVAAITLSLLPILWSSETGSDVLKRIAAPMAGGLLTSAALTLIVLPAVYSLWRERGIRPGRPLRSLSGGGDAAEVS